jgi:DNA-binding NarL/FixJ family response regulator
VGPAQFERNDVIAPDDQLVPSPPSDNARPCQTRHDLLVRSLESAGQLIEANNLRLSIEFVNLQRRALETIHEAASVTLTLAEFIRGASPSESVDAYLSHRMRRAAALNDLAFDFVRSALALVSGGSSDRFDLGVRADQNEQSREVLAQRIAELTSQQRKVLSLLLGGLPNKLIAYQLGIAESTVKSHVSQVLRKLNVYSRARIIALLLRDVDSEGLH